jgi:hypothetical protein
MDDARVDARPLQTGFWLWSPSAPLKGGSLNEQPVRLDDGEEDVEAVFTKRLVAGDGSPHSGARPSPWLRA